ncbi:MAG: 2-amino-4-oxopentanoate thiolase subunit OrtA [Propionibacteriaceae bacterium]|nr:2-amino-4-oxopentanoate thiolase subunit OrtA [Propionibacteriaceae bacterium]
MTVQETVPEGTWVEIQKTVLTPDERAQGVPQDTAATPLLEWVDGFLTHPAAIGDEATVRTLIGRTHTGVISRINPGYTHSFGETVGEILTIGTEAEA